MAATFSLLILALVGALATNAVAVAPWVCTRTYGSSCNEALGAWLPTGASGWFGTVEQRAAERQATRTKLRDDFQYEGKHPRPHIIGFEGPRDGTFFVYGTAGPPKGFAVYDYWRGIGFYRQGCCSWQQAVAVYVGAPPKPVVDRNLSDLRTIRGIRLDQTPGQVMHVYGWAPVLRVASHPDLRVLSYTTWPPHKPGAGPTPCGQFETFVFREDRLILIRLQNGC